MQECTAFRDEPELGKLKTPNDALAVDPLGPPF